MRINFEKNDIDKNKWGPTGGWDLDAGTLEVNGGEVGMSVKDDFTDFEFSVDFHMIKPTMGIELGRACGRSKTIARWFKLSQIIVTNFGGLQGSAVTILLTMTINWIMNQVCTLSLANGIR